VRGAIICCGSLLHRTLAFVVRLPTARTDDVTGNRFHLRHLGQSLRRRWRDPFASVADLSLPRRTGNAFSLEINRISSADHGWRWRRWCRCTLAAVADLPGAARTGNASAPDLHGVAGADQRSRCRLRDTLAAVSDFPRAARTGNASALDLHGIAGANNRRRRWRILGRDNASTPDFSRPARANATIADGHFAACASN
jgi:hypothetical protein